MSIALSQKRCFLFDLDGTLVDSNQSHENAYFKAIIEAAPALAGRFSYERCKGKRTLDVFRDLGIEDDELAKRLTAAKQKHYLDEIESGAVQLIPFAREILEFLRADNSRIFLVTSASRRSSQAILEYLSVGDFFESIVTGDDVLLAKPAPHCYLRCLSESKIGVAESVAIEDARSGIESAQEAGLEVIAVNNASLSDLDGYLENLEALQSSLAQERWR